MKPAAIVMSGHDGESEAKSEPDLELEAKFLHQIRGSIEGRWGTGNDRAA
jgi:hypothetical protein